MKAIARCKRIATHFHHSSKSSYILKEKQRSLGHKECAVIQEVSTCWNSSYYMVECILQQQQPLCATLLEIHKTDLMPTDSEFKTLEEFVTTMRPLVDITEAIGAEKWVTVSTLQPILIKLLQTHLVSDMTDSSLVKAMKTAILDDLKDRYTGDILDILTKAALLDPCFKNLKFLPESDRKSAVDSLKSDFDLVHFAVERSTSIEPPVPKRSKGEHKLLEFIVEFMEPASEDEVSTEQQLEIEVSRYMGEENTSQCPLEWWGASKRRYPLLSQLATRYLTIPATSVPCERVFSIAGHVVNEKRACLLPSNVNMLVFLAENLD